MNTQQAKPGFGRPKREPTYYTTVRAYVQSLQATTTLRTIAKMMNQMGWTSPNGLPWDRQRVANVMRNKAI